MIFLVTNYLWYYLLETVGWLSNSWHFLSLLRRNQILFSLGLNIRFPFNILYLFSRCIMAFCKLYFHQKMHLSVSINNYERKQKPRLIADISVRYLFGEHINIAPAKMVSVRRTDNCWTIASKMPHPSSQTTSF